MSIVRIDVRDSHHDRVPCRDRVRIGAGDDDRARAEYELGPVIADSQPLYLLGVCDAISGAPDFELVDAVTEGEAALRAIRSHRPAVALLGDGLPGLSVERILNALGRDGLLVAVIVLGDDAAGAYEALRRGATGYLLRGATREQVHDAIRCVARGTAVMATVPLDTALVVAGR